MQAELKKEDHANISENWSDGTMLYLLMPTVNMKWYEMCQMQWSFQTQNLAYALKQPSWLNFGKHGWNFVLLSHFLKLYQIIALFLHQAII